MLSNLMLPFANRDVLCDRTGMCHFAFHGKCDASHDSHRPLLVQHGLAGFQHHHRQITASSNSPPSLTRVHTFVSTTAFASFPSMDTDGAQKRRRRRAKPAATDTATTSEGVKSAFVPSRQPTLPQRKRPRTSTATREPTLPSPPPAPQPDEKDDEEKALESLLFGGLLHADQLPFGNEQTTERAEGVSSALRETDVESLFVIDKKGNRVAADAATAITSGTAAADGASTVPVWHDPDDQLQMIDLAAQPRLRKLRASDTEQRITAADYQQRLRQTYTNLNHAASWVKARRATADTLNEDAMWDVLRTSRSIKRSSDTTALPSGHLDIQALKDANAQQPAQVRLIHTHIQWPPHVRVCGGWVRGAVMNHYFFFNFRSADTIRMTITSHVSERSRTTTHYSHLARHSYRSLFSASVAAFISGRHPCC